MVTDGAGKKMQNVSFGHVDELLAYLPGNEYSIVVELRQLVYDCIPGVKEKLSYNVPFFRKRRNICFIWPSSVLWGKVKSTEGVRFGFTYGHLLQDDAQYLQRGTRKQVFWVDFLTLNGIDWPLLEAYIHEAAFIDQQFSK